MAYQLPVKYFNSFWLKKVVGDTNLDPKDEIESGGGTYNFESTVTTWTNDQNNNNNQYLLPTWPGVPWGTDLTQPNQDDPNTLVTYPCFPFGGRNWNSYIAGGALPSCQGSLINRNPSPEEGRERNWFVEEARIRGGYNNTSVDFGVAAYLVEDENEQQHRFNTLIYSGIYNSKTGTNNTNVFSTAKPITKSVDPQDGSIQKLYAYNTNLTIFQENKVSYALIDKDALYTAEGQGDAVSSLSVVIGQIVPYAGEYGISTNPESWAQYGLRQYFSDKYRGTIMRLGGDGLTEISSYGMKDFFRDELSLIKDGRSAISRSFSTFFDVPADEPQINFEIINNTPCNCEDIPVGALLQANNISVENLFVVAVAIGAGNCLVTVSKSFVASDFGLIDWPSEVEFIYYNQDTVKGGFDTHNKNYVISLNSWNSNSSCEISVDYNTLSFDEDINGWVSFYSYNPVFIDSLKNNFYSGSKYSLYQHYSPLVPRGNFYGVDNVASIEFIFNSNPSVVKNFQTINYEGTNGWEMSYMISDSTEFDYWNFGWLSTADTTNFVYSYDQGAYSDPITQQVKHAGFYRKENKYVANLVNASSATPGEVVFGNSMSGIKGYFTTVRFSTDVNTTDSLGNPLQATDPGGMKELYSVGTTYSVSSF